MKKALVLALLLLASPVFAGEWVNGHWKDTNRDGIKDTYVQPYVRSTPDNSMYNNYSTQGNFNPYTGQRGTVAPYNPYSSYQNYQPIRPYPYQGQNRRSGYR